MARLRTEYKIFLATFSLSFVALFIIHLVYLPYYWENASSQQGRPIDLYLPGLWIPAIVFYSALIAVIPVVAFSLLSWLRKDKADEIIIFITTFFLVYVVFWVLFTLAALRWGQTLSSYGDPYSKTRFVYYALTFFFSLVGAVFSVAVFDIYKLVRWARKRLKSKAET